MLKLPLPTTQILQLLRQEETMTPKQIQESLPQFTAKDIKYALRRLREKGIIKKIPNLVDMRRVFYRLSTLDEFAESALNLKTIEYNFYLSLLTDSEELVSTSEDQDSLAKIS